MFYLFLMFSNVHHMFHIFVIFPLSIMRIISIQNNAKRANNLPNQHFMQFSSLMWSNNIRQMTLEIYFRTHD